MHRDRQRGAARAGVRRRRQPRGWGWVAPRGRTRGNLGGNAQRTRHALNADTISEMHLAFRRGGRKAIEKVMRNNPAVFLKLLVLLVPREMKVEPSGGIKAMTTEQLELGIEIVKEMIAKREAEANAKLIEGTAERIPEQGK